MKKRATRFCDLHTRALGFVTRGSLSTWWWKPNSRSASRSALLRSQNKTKRVNVMLIRAFQTHDWFCALAGITSIERPPFPFSPMSLPLNSHSNPFVLCHARLVFPRLSLLRNAKCCWVVTNSSGLLAFLSLPDLKHSFASCKLKPKTGRRRDGFLSRRSSCSPIFQSEAQ